MESGFPFTQKKLLSMPLARRHKWIVSWLRTVYQSILNEDIHDDFFLNFQHQYSKALQWLDIELPEFPNQSEAKKWIELISNQFHWHQEETGLGLAESKFLPKVRQGDEITDHEWTAKHNYWVALDNLRSAFNVGSMIRTLDAAGWSGIITGGKTPSGKKLQVQKTSMGASDWIPEQHTKDLAQTLKEKAQEGIPIIGLETVEGAESCFDFEWPEKAILVVGNEEYGISQDVLATCTDFIQIPMSGRKNSLNVANAFAIIAFANQH
ncbi:MAG: 23S rRNA (guanosine2251-2'-O)-methyltransferase [bacterium]|jgi:23S rRNA (guanosine2251-2'-O)-methyltransferase